MSPNFLFCWPNAVIGLTEPQVVAQEIIRAHLSLYC
jgi:hypothetical protein